MSVSHISGLRIYPIKSFGGIELGASRVTPRGLEWDRRWMLVDQDGKFMTQRSDTRLALFRTSLSDQGIQVSFPAAGSIEVPFEPTGASRSVRVWNSECLAIQVSPEIDLWFSNLLQQDCSLVYMPESTHRQTHPDYTREGDIVGFADAFPILVIGEASLANLNGLLEEPLPMNRFRPNILCLGAAAHEEDNWRQISIGDVQLRYAKNCGRCSVTATNQETGIVGVEPLKTLATYRLDGKNVQFGSYFVPDQLGEIRVGDSINLLEG